MYLSEVLDTSLEERYAFFSDFLFDLYINALTFDYVACCYSKTWTECENRKNRKREFYGMKAKFSISWNFVLKLSELG